jgi:starch synthase (maltosyl-transferring)
VLPVHRPPRVAIEQIWPQVDEGRTPIRRAAGESVDVYADVFAEGTGGVRAEVRWRSTGERPWHAVPMHPVGNDRWRARFIVSAPGTYEYTVGGWVDPYLTWRTTLERRVSAHAVAPIDLVEGAEILGTIADRARGADAVQLRERSAHLRELARSSLADAIRQAMEPVVDDLVRRYPEPHEITVHPVSFPIGVDPARARHSAWYELFPRSASPDPRRAGTLRDVRSRLPHIADLGFDVVYLTPIHPIGHTGRRGPNNRAPGAASDPGSPWAIGSEKGGHTAIDPALGTLEDLRELVAECHRLRLDLALDLAFQCSPDHPWVNEHPTWFAHLPDGSIRTAENPPKRYDDIYPLDFATPDWRALWSGLKGVVDFWVDQGIRWFRVDNPHTKPFEFWKWLIGSVRQDHPDVLFLAEAFTRPKVMYHLAKVGFTHSYTYFAWRTTRGELVDYFRELSGGVPHEVLRPHLWPNTPDILTEQFHAGQRPVFLQRVLLAATLSAHYGIYGPAYELLEHVPLEAGKEEYRDSEKYQVRHWELDAPGNLGPEVRRINQIRRENPALTEGRDLTFHETDNDRLIAYSRSTDDASNVILVIMSLDPSAPQSGWTGLDLRALGVEGDAPFVVEDLWNGPRYQWHGPRNFVRLDPSVTNAHVFRVRTGTR